MGVESAGFNEAVKKALANKSPTSCEGAAGAILVIVNTGIAEALELTFIDSDLQAALLKAFPSKHPLSVRPPSRPSRPSFPRRPSLSTLPTLPKEIKIMANSRSRLGYCCPHQLIQSAPAQTGRPMLNIIPALGHKGRCKKATCRSLARATARVSKISNVLFPPQSRLQSTRSRRFPRFSCRQ